MLKTIHATVIVALLAPAMMRAQGTIAVAAGATSSLVVSPGAKFGVPILVDLSAAGGASLAAFTTGASWTATRLTIDSVKTGGFGSLTVNSNTGAGTSSLSMFDAAGATASFTMATMYFTASATAGGTRLMLAPTVAGDQGGNNILSLIRARALDICIGSATGKWGDVNGDNTVNIIDAQQIARHSVGLSVASAASVVSFGDVTADGSINIIDAQQIARYSVALSASARTNTIASAPPVVNAVQLAPSSPAVTVGGTTQLTATPLDAGSVDLAGCATIAWTSSDPAKASVNASGLVVGVATGTAVITATSGTRSAQVTVTVAAPSPTAVVLVDAGSGNVLSGGTLQLAATARDVSGNIITGRVFIWSTSDATKASVSASGLVTGVAPGTVQMSATTDGKVGVATVTVKSTSTIKTLSVSPRTATVLKDTTLRATAVVLDDAGNPLGDAITWTAGSPSIATVSSTGLITGVAGGIAKIYAATSGGLRDSIIVTVTTAAAAITKTWLGTTSSNWGTASNWTGSGVPLIADTVLIPATAPNQPVLGANAFVGAVVIKPGARLNIGAFELQVPGRVDNDGEIVGGANGLLIVQGPEGRASYVRGILPNFRVNGTTVLTGRTTVAGFFEVFPSSIFDVNAWAANVTGYAQIKGALLMRNPSDSLNVRGTAEFFNDVATSKAELKAGVLRVGGNLTLQIASAGVATPFPASGTHRTVLDGATTQTVTNVGIDAAVFQELDIAKPSGGVVFVSAEPTRFRVQGRFTSLTATAISGSGRVNVLSDFTAAGGSVTLRNLAVRGAITSAATFTPDTLTLLGLNQIIPSGTTYQYQTVVAAGTGRLVGTTSMSRSLIVGCLLARSDCTIGIAAMDLAGRKVTVGGDLRQTLLQPTAPLFMRSNMDSLIVRGGVLGPVLRTTGAVEFTVSAGDWTAGTLWVGGDFTGRGTGPSDPTVTIPGTHHTILDGATTQNMRIITGYFFRTFTIRTAAGGVVHGDTIGPRLREAGVRGDFTLESAVRFSGNGRINVLGNVQTNPGSTVEVGAISVGQLLLSAGAYSPDTAEFNNAGTLQTIQSLPAYKTVQVRGKAVFGGSMTFSGSLIVLPGAELNVGNRHVTVANQLKVSGILRMQDQRDTITVLGDTALFTARNDPQVRNYATNGVLRVAGHMVADSTGFYPAGTHKTIWMPSVASRSLRGAFQELEIVQTGASTAQFLLRGVWVRGTLNAVNGTGRLSVEGLRVTGNALLTQVDTVVVQPSALFQVGGNLTLRKMRFESPSLATVDNDVTLLDGGYLAGRVVHGRTYAEQGTPANVINADPILAGLKSVRWVQQPTSRAPLVPFSPAVSVEILDLSGARIHGTAVVALEVAQDILIGTRRAISVDGVATFPGLAMNGVGNPTLYAKASTLTGIVANGSNSFLVTAGAPAQVRFMTAAGVPQPVRSPIVAGAEVRSVGGGSIRAQVTDATGFPVPLSGQVILKTGAASPGGSTTLGTLTLDSQGGANFFVNSPGAAGIYTLVAQVGTLISIPSDAYTVIPGAVTRVVMRTAAGATGLQVPVTAGSAIRAVGGSNLRVQATDAYGNAVPYAGTVTLSAGGEPVSDAPAVTFDANGAAEFPTVRLRKVGTYVLTPVSGLPGAPSESFTVVPSVATRVAITTSTGLAGVKKPVVAGATVLAVNGGQLGAQVIDSLGNNAVLTGQILIRTGPASPDTAYGVVRSTINPTGSALFSLSLRKAGVYTLIPSVPTAPGMTSVATDTFTVSAAASAQVVLMNTDGTPQKIRSPQDAGSPLATTSGEPIRMVALDAFDNRTSALLQSAYLILLDSLNRVIALSPQQNGSAAPVFSMSSNTAGLYRLQMFGSAPGQMASLTDTFRVRPLAPSQLFVTTQPLGGTSGFPLTTQPRVEVRDQYGNRVSLPGDSIIASVTGGLAGTAKVPVVNGVATFTTLQINQGGVHTLSFQYIQGTTPKFSVNSQAFNVAQAPATKLVIVQPPAGAVANAAFATQPRLETQDANGNPVPTTGTVFSVALGAGGTGVGTLTGSLSNGPTANQSTVGLFSLKISAPGTYNLVFSATAFASVTMSIVVANATPAKLAFVTQPNYAISGSTMRPQPVIQVNDATNLRAAGATTPVTIAVPGAVLQGTITVAAIDGVVTFAGVRISGSTTIQPSYSATGLTSVTTQTFPVQIAVPTMSRQPTGGASAALLGIQPIVNITNGSGTVHTLSDNVLSVALIPAVGSSGTLSGTTTVTAVNGVVTFTDLRVTNTGTVAGSYMLEFTGFGLFQSVRSAAFSVAKP